MADSIEKETLDSLAEQMGGEEALGRIIAMYTHKLPDEMSGLRDAFESGDLESVQSSAHRLKSSSGQLGAKRLSVMLAGLETVSREGDGEAAARILDQVVVEAEAARLELLALSP